MSALPPKADIKPPPAGVLLLVMGGRFLMSQRMFALPLLSDVNLFGNCDSVIDLNAEISDGTFDLGVTKQKLHGTQVPCASIDQGCLGSPE